MFCAWHWIFLWLGKKLQALRMLLGVVSKQYIFPQKAILSIQRSREIKFSTSALSRSGLLKNQAYKQPLISLYNFFWTLLLNFEV